MPFGRRSTPKAKSGCRTCKARHVKCDETKPSCGNCSKTGRICDGYEVKMIPQSSLLCVSNPSAYSIPFRIPGSRHDRMMLNYFCVTGSSQLAGHVKSEFWEQLTLRYSHEFPFIRQCLVALSSFHLHSIQSSWFTTLETGLIPLNVETLQEYNKAISQLRRYIHRTGSPSIEAILIATVLLHSFDILRGESSMADAHLKNGIILLSRSNFALPPPLNEQGISYNEDQQLIYRELARFDVQCSAFGLYDRLPLLALPNPGLAQHEIEFKDLHDAVYFLDCLKSHCYHFLSANKHHDHEDPSKIASEILAIKYDLSCQLDCWACALTKYLASNGEDSAIINEGAAVLRGHYLAMRMLISSRFPYNREVFGASSNVWMEKILDLTEQSAGDSWGGADTDGVDTSKRTISAKSGLVGPLIYLSARLEDEAARKRCLDALATLNRWEGLWKPFMNVTITESFSPDPSSCFLESVREEPPVSSQGWAATS